MSVWRSAGEERRGWATREGKNVEGGAVEEGWEREKVGERAG